jgi:hypothetical protein
VQLHAFHLEDVVLLPAAKGRHGTSRLRYSLIDVDDSVIPRNGVNLDFRTQWFDASPAATSAFPLPENQMTVFKRLNEPSSVLFSAFGGTRLDTITLVCQCFLLEARAHLPPVAVSC